MKRVLRWLGIGLGGLLADGQRLTALWGCAGCHGDRLAGELMFEQLFLGRIAAPNLTRILPL